MAKKLIVAVLVLLFLIPAASCRPSAPGIPAASAPESPPDVSVPPETSVPDSSQVYLPAAPETPQGEPQIPDETPDIPEEPEEPVPEPEPEEPAPEPEKPAPPNTKLYILMYHHFVEGDGTGCNDWTLPVSRFRENLQWLQDHGYTTLLPSQLAAGEPLPARAVLITMDDGYASNYWLAYPVLKEFGAKAVISLITRNVQEERPDVLSWDMCREMVQSGLVEIGSHTYSCHEGNGIKRRSGESREEYEARVLSDIETSIEQIRDALGAAPSFFAYPGGNTDRWARDFLREHFSVTVTTRHGPANISGGLYDLPRHNISLSEDVTKFLPD